MYICIKYVCMHYMFPYNPNCNDIVWSAATTLISTHLKIASSASGATAVMCMFCVLLYDTVRKTRTACIFLLRSMLIAIYSNNRTRRRQKHFFQRSPRARRAVLLVTRRHERERGYLVVNLSLIESSAPVFEL